MRFQGLLNAIECFGMMIMMMTFDAMIFAWVNFHFYMSTIFFFFFFLHASLARYMIYALRLVEKERERKQLYGRIDTLTRHSTPSTPLDAERNPL